jgi:hypothetical protein
MSVLTTILGALGGGGIAALASAWRARESRHAATAVATSAATAEIEREREVTGRHAIASQSEVIDRLLDRLSALEAQAAARESRSVAREERHQRELAAARAEREACRVGRVPREKRRNNQRVHRGP